MPASADPGGGGSGGPDPPWKIKSYMCSIENIKELLLSE